jgi:hypothetical protein
MTWLHKTWLKTLALAVAVAITVFGLVSLAAAPVWPVVGVAVAALALVWNGMTSRLSQPTCLHCGENLNDQPAGLYGIICPGCGGLNEPPTHPQTSLAASAKPTKQPSA